MYSDVDLAEQQELVKDIAIEAGIWIVAPEAKALQLVSKLGKIAKLGKQVTKGGKVLIQLQEKVVGKEGFVA